MFNTIHHKPPADDAVAIHRNAFNAAFYELGLRWHWCADTYPDHLMGEQESEHIRAYLQTHQPHLLTAYDVDFLVNAIQTTKSRCYDAMVTCGTKVAAFVNWAEIQKCEVGV